MKTLKLRIKDKHSKYLQQLAREVNLVWNYVNELGFKYWQRHKKFLSAYDIHEYTAGASKELNLHSQTIQAVSEELVTRRKQFNKVKLRWRVSNPKAARRSLGWIPFKKAAIKYQNGQVRYGKQWLGLWDSYGIAKYNIKTGSFVQDARGRWYVCLVVDNAPKIASTGTSAVGIDLGLKTLATCSDGEKRAAPRIYRKYQPQLAIAQRAHKKQRVRAIHAKIKNIRNHELNVFTTQLVKKHAAIFIGNVNAQALAKTKLAKSVLDASWGRLKTMLKYKCENAGVWFEIVDEANTTQTCSCCNAKPSSSPKGRAGLGIREWTCVECGVTHDRDVNAAKNILALGHERLAGGIPCL